MDAITQHPIPSTMHTTRFIQPAMPTGSPVELVECRNAGTKKEPHFRYLSSTGYWFDHDDVAPGGSSGTGLAETGHAVSKSGGDAWDRGTYPNCAVRKNPVPKLSTIENLLKRKEWRGATVGEPFQRTYRTWVHIWNCGMSNEEIKVALDEADAKRWNSSAIEIAEQVEVVEVRHPSGCVLTLRTMTGEALADLRRQAWREATPPKVSYMHGRPPVASTPAVAPAPVVVEQPKAPVAGADHAGDNRALEKSPERTAEQSAKVATKEPQPAPIPKGDSPRSMLELRAAHEAACAARRSAKTPVEIRAAVHAYNQARRAIARASCSL